MLEEIGDARVGNRGNQFSLAHETLDDRRITQVFEIEDFQYQRNIVGNALGQINPRTRTLTDEANEAIAD